MLLLLISLKLKSSSAILSLLCTSLSLAGGGNPPPFQSQPVHLLLCPLTPHSRNPLSTISFLSCVSNFSFQMDSPMPFSNAEVSPIFTHPTPQIVPALALSSLSQPDFPKGYLLRSFTSSHPALPHLLFNSYLSGST